MRKNPLTKLRPFIFTFFFKRSTDFFSKNKNTFKTAELKSNTEHFLLSTKSSSKVESFSGHCVDSDSVSSPAKQKVYEQTDTSDSNIDLPRNFNSPALSMSTNEPEDFETFSPDDEDYDNVMLSRSHMLNLDPDPEIIYRSSQPIEYDQDIQIRYLKPPTPPPPGIAT